MDNSVTALIDSGIHRNMGLLGCNTVDEIGPQSLLFTDSKQLLRTFYKPGIARREQQNSWKLSGNHTQTPIWLGRRRAPIPTAF